MASDKACDKPGSVARVSIAIARKVGKKCAFLGATAKLGKPGSCKARVSRLAKGTSRFIYKVKAKLPKGKYVVTVQVADAAGNLSRGPKKTLKVK